MSHVVPSPGTVRCWPQVRRSTYKAEVKWNCNTVKSFHWTIIVSLSVSLVILELCSQNVHQVFQSAGFSLTAKSMHFTNLH